ncbi:MAG TPA: DUF2937 family protein [Spirochaetota bacterium]|nr:DUF2937 family protein [Spirochaetota bacterium]HPG50591.1 DUF2937 family protein [Spirochaetota bacterium]HPN13717.1 DUF2937 family protein [Spirochaetota bacterium]
MMFDKRKILMAPVRFLDSIADRICAVLGALALAQFPQYLVLYIQRLGGHVDEAARNMDKYREIAKELGKTMYQYSQHMLASKDPAVFKTGQKIALDLERYDSLAAALKELQEAPAFQKFFVFIKTIDLDIARATWDNFTFGLPLTWEAAGYAVAGIIIGMLLYFCVSRLIMLIVKKIAARR